MDRSLQKDLLAYQRSQRDGLPLKENNVRFVEFKSLETSATLLLHPFYFFSRVILGHIPDFELSIAAHKTQTGPFNRSIMSSSRLSPRERRDIPS